ncbi:MAG: hypothetical protein VR73_09250 [Gammaproteobacteria bacterium BRH_c0]|nr:MAG: hypothetical protein VR73_09250 [Gammaproteobacteria bacterium BRH_c0]
MVTQSGFNRHGVLWLVALALLYFLSARLSVAVFSLPFSGMILLWLPAGIGLIMAMAIGWKALPLIMLVSFLANSLDMSVDGFSQWMHTLILTFADGLAPCLAAQLFRLRLPSGLQMARDLGPFTLYICLLPSLIGSAITLGTFLWGGSISWQQVPNLGLNLVLAYSLGILLIWPLYQLWRQSEPLDMAAWLWILFAVAVNGLLFLLTVQFSGGLVFLILPVLLMLTFKARPQGVLLALLVTTIILITGAIRMPGPCVIPDNPEARPMLMGFVFTMTYVVLCLCLYYRELLASDTSRQRWRNAALHDPLTGLTNRRALMKTLSDESDRSKRTGRPFALAMLDLDHFKRINDNHGHKAGDHALKAIADLLHAQCRGIDSVARMGGEEFAILLPETSLASAIPVMQRILEAVEALDIRLASDNVRLTISIGVVDASEGGSVDQLLEEADARLYQAKRDGRNRIVASSVDNPD